MFIALRSAHHCQNLEATKRSFAGWLRWLQQGPKQPPLEMSLRKIVIKWKCFQYLKLDIIVEPLSMKNMFLPCIFLGNFKKYLFFYLYINVFSMELDFGQLKFLTFQVDIDTNVLYKNASFGILPSYQCSKIHLGCKFQNSHMGPTSRPPTTPLWVNAVVDWLCSFRTHFRFAECWGRSWTCELDAVRCQWNMTSLEEKRALTIR